MATFVSKAENLDDSKPSMGCHGASEDTGLCCHHYELDQAPEFQKLFLLLPSAGGKHFSPPTSLKSERLFPNAQRARNSKAEGAGSQLLLVECSTSAAALSSCPRSFLLHSSFRLHPRSLSTHCQSLSVNVKQGTNENAQ